jgi:hypothetical protein
VAQTAKTAEKPIEVPHEQTARPIRSFPLSEEEEKAHIEFLENKIKDAVWLK